MENELWCQLVPVSSLTLSTVSPNVQTACPHTTPLCPPSRPWIVAACGITPSSTAVAPKLDGPQPAASRERKAPMRHERLIGAQCISAPSRVVVG